MFEVSSKSNSSETSKSDGSKSFSRESSDARPVKSRTSSPVSDQKASKSLSNKTNSSDCKFCSSGLHSSLRCNKFVSHRERVDQARMLKLCLRCLSSS